MGKIKYGGKNTILMREKKPHMLTEMNSQIFGKNKWQRPASRHGLTIFFNYKATEVLLRSVKERNDVERTNIKLTSDFSASTLVCRRELLQAVF